MRRLFISTFLAFLMGITAFARPDTLTVKPFLHNWTFTVAVGGDLFFNPGHADRGRLMPGLDLVAGKEFSPYGGARLGLQQGGLSLWGTAPRYRAFSEQGLFQEKSMFKERVNFLYLHGDVLWNFTNTFWGYDPGRLFTFSPYMHFGFFFETGGGHFLEREFASGIGFLGEWRLSPQWSASFDLRGALYTGAVSPDRASGRLISLSALAGMTWHPLGGGWQRYRQGVVLHNSFWNNWFISAMAGVNTIGVYGNFKGAGAPGTDLTLGRWFSPSFAMRAGWQGGQFAGRGRQPLRYVEATPEGSLFLERFRFDYFHGDVLWNWLPYSPRNRWITGPYVHMGFLVERGLKGGLIGRHYAGGPGWHTRFRIIDGLELQLDLRGFLLNGGTAGDAGSGHIIAGSALAGLSYTLGRPGWERWQPAEEPVRAPRQPGQPFQIGRFSENWSTRLLLGATGSSLAADLSVSKWFTPEIGLRAGYQGFSLSEVAVTTGFAYLHQDLLVSALDLLMGYRPGRRVQLAPYFHFGVIAEYEQEAVPWQGRGYEYAAGAGVSASVALDRHLGLAAEFRETLLTSSATPAQRGMGMASTILVGLEYSFGERSWRSIEHTPCRGERLSRFWDNWFISTALGVNGFTGLEAWNSRAALAADLSLGKWFSPQFGVRGGLQGLRLARVGTAPRSNAIQVTPTEDGRLREELGFAYLHGDFLWNLTNTLLPYRENRLWNVIPYMHMGALVEFGTGAAYKGIFERELAEGPGLLQSFRIDDDLDLFLDLRAIVVRGQASGDATSRVGLIPAALIGLTGHPGGRGFDTVERNAPEALRSEKARWALSLNLADAALLGTAGGSLQWGPSRHISVENSLRLNAFSFRDATLYDQRQTFTTAVRWWPWHIYSGFYVRASAQVETARRKGIPFFSEGAGEAYGAGLSAGYSLLLSRHLNLEFGAGFWGGRLRPAGTENRRWFIAPDGLTLAIVLVL